MRDDLRYALRLLNRHRGFAAVAILTIAVGVGANAAVFSVADSVLFRPLPFPDADRLFALRLTDVARGEAYGTLPGAAVDAARDAGIFDGVAAVSSRTWRAYVHENGQLAALTLAPVSQQYVQLLGLRPAVGRTFDTSDTGTHALLLSYRTWMERYGGDPGVVGRLVPAILRPTESYPLTQPPLRIVGVLPPRLRLPMIGDAEALVLDDEPAGGPGRSFAPLVRLRAGITTAQAQARLASVNAPEVVPGRSVLELFPLREELARRQDPLLWLLFGASALVLLAACANVATLLVARGSTRTRELAVRAALGASPRRLARLLLVDAALLASFGMAAGTVLAYWGFHVLAGRLPPTLARTVDPAFDTRTLVFAFIASAVCAMAFGVAPAVRLSRADARDGLLRRFRRSPDRTHSRQILMGAEVAICTAGLIVAALVGRTLNSLLSQDLGFQPHRLAITFDLPTMVVQQGARLRTDTTARAAFYRARLQQVRTLQGVRAAALASAVPFSGIAPDAALLDRGGRELGGVFAVSGGYFRAMGTPLIAGRDLTDAESFSNAPFGVLNESGARLLCGTAERCLGTVVHAPDQPARTVIGIVADARTSVRGDVTPSMFVPFESSFALKTLIVDMDDTPATRDALENALAVSRDVRVNIHSLAADREEEIAPFRFNAIAVGAFAAMTLLLAVVGVYGVISAVVGERKREYAIRLALGATRQRVRLLVLTEAAMPILAGGGVGILVSAWLSRFLASLLYGVMPRDAVSFVVAAAVVASAGAAAALVPARRAGFVDPITALKAE